MIESHGAVKLDIWTFTSWCQQVGSSERYPDKLIDAKVSDRVAGLSSAFVDSLRSAFANPVATVA